MTRFWITASLLLLLAFLFAGGLVAYFFRARAEADLLRCQNNLREIAVFAGRFSHPLEGEPRLTSDIPAGTLANPALPPTERLSWLVTALPWLDQKRTPAAELFATIDRTQAWSAGPNEAASRQKLTVLFCPGMPPEVAAGEPAPTNYFGSAGLGANAATLAIRDMTVNLGGFGKWPVRIVPPNAGCFRYDAPTPFDAVADGLSQTILLGEREPAYGPWLRGGPSTVRGVDIAPDAPPRIGTGGQFGGGHPVGANFAFADGSVRVLTPRIDPRVLDSLTTIAGGERESLRDAE